MNIIDILKFITTNVNKLIQKLSDNNDESDDYTIYIYIACILIIIYSAFYLTKKAVKIGIYILIIYFVSVFLINFFESLYYSIFYNRTLSNSHTF